LITVSEEGARVTLSQRVAAPDKVVTIHNGIPDCSERADLHATNSPVITMVARFSPVKDHGLLLRAFTSLHPSTRLRLVGDGPLRQSCERLARELGIYNRVEFLGNRDDVPTILAGSDVFVLASTFEMLPISVLEAMRAGLPIVATDVGGVSEAVVHGETGLLVPAGSATALAEALGQLAADRDLRLFLGRAGRRRFTEQFLYAQQEARTRSVYLDVLIASGKAVPVIKPRVQAA
jgi:glycosyltransferase involved in cell wall biosynthesis